ncbi:MAG: orotidine-5'-phosphate decarboxylase [Planctomycetes bacterium]|nr:orotidine-5'-phosphate decarboxylase [Planctomycetota bacterium]MCP4860819.1 orotidine-5'-phosphate decarboxylase [Planctomycetota bacterium]
MLFPDRLHQAIEAKGSPAMVGLDPRLDSLPEPFATRVQAGPAAAAEALKEYHRALIDVIAPHVAIIKPQSAFFEVLGAAGFDAMADACAYAKERGLLVLMDAKRGDIGSTSEAYASTFLGGGFQNAFPPCDALTVNPYLGSDAAEPFLAAADTNQAGVFFLVKTSNPGAGLFQDHGTPPLADIVASQVAEWGKSRCGESGWSSIGAVVGATRPQELAHFRSLMPNAVLLLPGFGFQGGTADGLSSAFDAHGQGAVVNASRSILFAFQREDLQNLKTWEERTEVAVVEMQQQLASVSGGARA